tara:strand:- start:1712 stop:3817 length:2106 start_codon:yes stop_codon:yes gene_type:complete
MSLKKYDLDKLNIGILIVLSIFLLLIYLISLNEFNYYLFGDRDLNKAKNLLNDFQFFGAEMNHQEGARVPGGFLYYYLFIIQKIFGPEINKVYYICSLLNLTSFIFFLYALNKNINNLKIILLTLIIFLTSSDFVEYFFRFWNPSLGLFFLIMSYSFFTLFLKNFNIKFFYISITFTLISGQFHLTYLLPGIFYFLFWITKFYKKIKISYIFIIILIFSIIYGPSIYNNYSKINQNFNNYETELVSEIEIQQTKNIQKENNKKSIKLHDIIEWDKDLKIYEALISKIHKNIKLIGSYDSGVQQFNISIILILLLVFYLSNNNFSKNRDNFFLSWLTYFLFIIFLFYILYLYTYGVHAIGTSGRYNIFILPIMAFILSKIIADISSYYNFKKIFFLFNLFLLIKVISVFYVLKTDVYPRDLQKFKYKKIIEKSLSKKNIDKETALSKIIFLNLDKLVMDYQIKNSNYIKSRTPQNSKDMYNENCYALIWTGDSSNTNKINLRDLVFFEKRKITKYENLGQFLLIEFKDKINCPNNLSNDYIKNNDEKKIEEGLSNLEVNKIYKINNEYYGKIKNLSNNSLPLNFKFGFKDFKDERDEQKKLFFLSSKQFRSNTILKGYYGGYTLESIKILFLDNQENLIHENKYENINLGLPNNFYKSPIYLFLENSNNLSYNKIAISLNLYDNNLTQKPYNARMVINEKKN